MASEHIDEPLDYLYEELPPEKMAEARRHLAACPQCREEIAAVREVVKTYRQIDRPAPPQGLARRVAAQALEAARQAHAPKPAEENPQPASTPVPEGKAADPDFDHLKQELLREVRGGWKRWLFHPAWTVAASVVFVCAVLIHMSPRWEKPAAATTVGDAQAISVPAAPEPAAARQDEAAKGAAGSENAAAARPRLPASAPKKTAAAAPPAQLAPPALSEAEALEKPVPPQPALPPIAQQAVPPASTEAETLETPVQSSPGLPPVAPPAAPSAVSPAVPIRERAIADFSSAASAPALPPVPAPAPVPPRSPAMAAPMDSGQSLRPPAAMAPAPSSRSAGPQVPGRSAATEDNLFEALVAPKTKLPDAAAGGAALAEPKAEPEPAQEPTIVGISPGDEPPRLIERSEAVDTAKLALDLAFLAGIQMGQGELSEAWITIGMLRRYDAKKAAELAEMLTDMEKQADLAEAEAAKAEATDKEAKAGAETKEAERELPVDKYFVRPSGEMAGNGRTIETPADAETLRPAVTGSMAPPPPAALSSTASADTVQADADIPSAPAEERAQATATPTPAASQADAYSSDTHAYGAGYSGEPVADAFAAPTEEAPVLQDYPKQDIYVGPVYSENDPRPPLPSQAAPRPATPPAPAPAAPVVIVPPGAVPPTLGESTGLEIRETPSRSTAPKRPFSTDPYIRGD